MAPPTFSGAAEVGPRVLNRGPPPATPTRWSGLLSTLLVLFTLGLATPWAIVMRYRWRTNHTVIDDRRLRFTGSGIGLFGSWVKWWVLSIITLGVYLFWVIPRLTRWTFEHQDFA